MTPTAFNLHIHFLKLNQLCLPILSCSTLRILKLSGIVVCRSKHKVFTLGIDSRRTLYLWQKHCFPVTRALIS